ncbi:MAG TPA: hypothetical protein VGM88_13415 [Kofleriaceae bacterium]
MNRTSMLAAALAAALAALVAAPLAAHAQPADAHAQPADAPIHLVLRGADDAEAFRAHLEEELGEPVALVRGACEAICVDVSIDGTTATVLVSPRSGTVRERSVELGDDHAQWPTIVTLLAGNLARDEAADMLAALPPREPPVVVVIPPHDAPPRPLAPPPPAYEQRMFTFGLVPLLDSDFTHVGRIRHDFAVDLVFGVHGGSSVLAIGGAASVETGPVSGFQIGGAATVAGELHGVQIAGAVAVAERVRGTQVAGALTVSEGDANVQIAGGLAVAKRVVGAQVAGGLNIAGTVDGAQIAPINIARRNDGVQVGVVNIGGGNDGYSIGLLNFVRGGRTDLEAAFDTNQLGTLVLRHGSRHWHNAYGIGGRHEDDAAMGKTNNVWLFGLGMGPTWTALDGRIDVDAMAWHVAHGDTFGDFSLLNQLRVTYEHKLGPVGLIAGAAANVLVTDDHSQPLLLERRASAADDKGVSVLIWPSAFVGVRL